MIELPRQEPCEICETLAGRTNVPVVAESEFTITVVTPVQFEVGQCCVVTRRHVATLLDLFERTYLRKENVIRLVDDASS